MRPNTLLPVLLDVRAQLHRLRKNSTALWVAVPTATSAAPFHGCWLLPTGSGRLAQCVILNARPNSRPAVKDLNVNYRQATSQLEPFSRASASFSLWFACLRFSLRNVLLFDFRARWQGAGPGAGWHPSSPEKGRQKIAQGREPWDRTYNVCVQAPAGRQTLLDPSYSFGRLAQCVILNGRPNSRPAVKDLNVNYWQAASQRVSC
jgi:hypothetical protein